ncbi:MAG: hypothetical protein CME69_08290 [Halobacteriovorax sp.]|nr:hypothetical protein [Halobacteriovorax sp.]|tara:strand:+ start:1622 stop:2056 length:435 start_codon:yes stop_codon:yes gene_type:complete
MKILLISALLASSLLANASKLDCSLYTADKFTGRELSQESMDILTNKGYQLTTEADDAKFEVVLHSKRNPYKNRTYETYKLIKGEINGQEVVSGKTIESTYDGFIDELGDAINQIFSSDENPFESVDSCSTMYESPSFEYIEAK